MNKHIAHSRVFDIDPAILINKESCKQLQEFLLVGVCCDGSAVDRFFLAHNTGWADGCAA